MDQVQMEKKIKELWQENIILRDENLELKKQIEKLNTLKKALIKTVSTQSDQITVMESNTKKLRGYVNLLTAMVKEEGVEDATEQETEERAC